MNDHLRKWLANSTVKDRERVALKAGTTVGHLRQLSGGHRKASVDLAERLQDASSGSITIAGLRPDLVVIAEKILMGASLVAGANALPTLDQKINPIPAADQSANPAVISSSTGAPQ